MPVLCQLRHPTRYRVSEWNIVERADDRAHWLNLFATFPGRIEPHLREDGLGGQDFDRRWAAFLQEYRRGMQPFLDLAARGGPVHTIDLCRFRQGLLDRHGWPDPYRLVKRRENAAALELYPRVIAAVDAAGPDRRWDLLLRGFFAGNMFDLGSLRTIEMYHNGQMDFQALFAGIRPRPWFADGTDALLARLGGPARWRQALVFTDNAGSDAVLGALPIARELARRGVRVVLAANSRPALNDITAGELLDVLHAAADVDPFLAGMVAGDRIAVVPSGGDMPLIDLSRVSPECDAQAAASDLIVLQGMGRAVESNWHEAFRCDVWRLALIKDESVARWLGASLFEPVSRYDPC